jgi:hypothetical protein
MRERDDGYAFRCGSDPTVSARMAELVTLEPAGDGVLAQFLAHVASFRAWRPARPFLDFRLEWAGADDGRGSPSPADRR